MARILGVGNATLDIVNSVDGFPAEDDEVRAEAQHISRGGNAANTLVVLSQLGHQCAWAGTLADEPDARHIHRDFDHYRIDSSAARVADHGKVPTSYVILNRRNGTRTIVHYRDLPEYGIEDFRRIDLDRFDWLHFEGRNIGEVRRMMHHARRVRPELPISLEAEKPRSGLETLFADADLLLFSRVYARSRGAREAEAFLQGMHRELPQADLVCAWGDRGAEALTRDGQHFTTPAFAPPFLVDTLGAGDVFNAGIIDSRLRGQSLDIGLIEASRLAGRKCGQHGLADLVR